MSCKIIYREGKIDRVLDSSGNTSRLFNQIASLPFVDSLEEALESYKNIYTEEVVEEPILAFVSDKDNYFLSYKSALDDSSGGNISVKINENTIYIISSNTNVNTPEGFKNFYIKAGLMSDQRVIENGESFLQAQGNNQIVKAVNEFIIDEDAKSSIGTANRTVTRDGRITIRDVKGKVTLSNGETVNISDFDSMSKEEIMLKFPTDSDMILSSKAVKESILDRTFGTPTQEDLRTQLSERELRVRLLGLLEKMGVSITTIDEYVKNHNTRNNVDPSANALADIANQIVAFKNGEITTEALTEETAHFIVEAWNEEDISDLIRNIDKTNEYKEFSDFYRNLYQKENLSSEETENLVRREILGKILAKSLINDFSTENTTDVESNIVDYIRNLFNSFIQKVQSLFNVQDEVNLIDFTNQVNDLLLNQNIDNYLNLTNLNNKKFVMYQASPGSDLLLRQSKGLLQILQQQEKDLLKAGKGLKSNVKRLRDLEQQIDTLVVRESILEFLNTAKRQAKYINQAADIASKNNNFLTNEEGIVYSSLKNSMMPVLSEIKDFLVKENSSENKNLINEINSTILEVSDIEGKIRNQDNRILETIVDRMIIRHSLPQSTKAMVMDATKAALNDTTAFYATFGQLSHARDPLLNIAGTIIHDLEMEANVNFLRPTKDFQKRLRELGFQEKDLSQFFDNGYLVDIRDWNKFEEKESDISANILKEVSGTTLTIQEIKDLKRDPKSHKGLIMPQLNSEQNQEYNKRYRTEMSPYLETVFNEQYYKDEEKKYTDNNISDITIRERKDLSIDRGVLLSRVREVDGRVRFTNQDKIDLNALNIKRRKLKSLYTDMGIIKTGLTEPFEGSLVEKISPDAIEVNGKIIQIDRSIASPEAIIAFDLNKLDLLYQQEQRENPTSLSSDFLEELKNIESIEGREEALDFFRLNTFTNFSESYWNGLDSSGGFIERLQEVEDTEEVVDKIKKLSTKRRQMIKQYQSQQDASNILVDEMSKDVRQEILDVTDEIDRLFLEGSRMLSDTRSDEEITSPTENTPNESYFNEVEGFSGQEKIQFILENTTATNKRRINEFSYALDELSNGKSLSSSKQKIYDRFNRGSNEATLLAYSETKLAPYYVRFAPLGFSSLQDRLTNSQESVYDVVTEMNNNTNLQVTNNFSYYKAEEQAYRNKNFKPDFEGGFFQPKISQFKNDKFEQMFNPTIVDGEVVSVGKNQKLYDLYNEMLDYHRKSLAVMGELGSHNLWKAPQISKTGMNKFTDFLKEKNKRGTISESIKDALFYRVDDLAYGAEINGESAIKSLGARYIPKYYLRNLEKASDVSEDLFYSMSAFGQQAYLYESRKNYFSDMMAIQEALVSREYPEGKSAESSSTVKMFKSAMDAYLFGVKESKQLKVSLPIVGQVDLTKNIRFLHKWVMNRNLGFNAVIPFTSWVTAESQTMIEKYVGEYLNPHSTKLAQREFLNLSTDAIKDTLEVNSTAKLSVMLEHFGVYNAEEKFRNSIYGKTFRNIPKIGMALNQAANFPIIPRVALNVLYDYRVVGDDIINFNQFERIQKDSGVAKKEIVSNWKLLEDKALYNYMKVDESSVKYDLDKLRQDTNREGDFETFMNEKEKAVTTRIREIVKFVDGQIPEYERSAAQRHFFLSFFTTHRGWLSIAYARRFKNKHFNFQTGQEEQGSYRSFANFITNNLSGLYKDGFKDFIKNSKEQWENADEIERSNMKRVMIELAFLQGIVGIGWLLGAIAEDDDNKDLYALQLTNYLYYRLMNETTSSQVAIGGQFYDLVKSPIVGADTVKSIFSVANYFDTDTIESGRYAGMEKWQKQLMSTIPGYKSAIDIGNPKDAYDSYKHFNPDTEIYNPIWWLLETKE